MSNDNNNKDKKNPFHVQRMHLTEAEAPYGYCLLSRDTKTWGEEGTGSEAVNPDAECEIQCPHYNDQDFNSYEDIIHLNIASFRDRLCPRTLHNLFHKAANPKRIYVRIIQQVELDSNEVDDGDCWENYCKNYNSNCEEEYRSQIRIWTMNAKIAKGPTDPRSRLSAALTYDYEHPHDPLLHPVQIHDYCMQTDSHMDFNQDFDVGLIDMFHRTQNDYAVLSTYVAPMEQTDTDPANVPHLCMVSFTSTWRNWGTKSCDNLLRPKMTNIPWGAGLSFEKCHADLNVPYDPYLPGIFDGEELSRGFRFFTHGYDTYTPDKVLVTHDYHGHQSNPHVHTWGRHSDGNNNNVGDDMSAFMGDIEEVKVSVSPKGVQRLNVMMGIENNLDKHGIITNSRFGLGKQRTIEQATEFSGFNPSKRKMVKNKCGNLNWVPFEEANDTTYGADITLARPLWNGEKKKEHQDVVITHYTKTIPSKENNDINDTTKSSSRMVRHNNPSSSSQHNNPLYSLIVIIFTIIIVVTMVIKLGLHKKCRAKKSARRVA